MTTTPYSAEQVVEVLRKEICKLPRYSFLVGGKGGVVRDENRAGAWVEFDEVHKLFDMQTVDELIAKSIADEAIGKAKL